VIKTRFADTFGLRTTKTQLSGTYLGYPKKADIIGATKPVFAD